MMLICTCVRKNYDYGQEDERMRWAFFLLTPSLPAVPVVVVGLEQTSMDDNLTVWSWPFQRQAVHTRSSPHFSPDLSSNASNLVSCSINDILCSTNLLILHAHTHSLINLVL